MNIFFSQFIFTSPVINLFWQYFSVLLGTCFVVVFLNSTYTFLFVKQYPNNCNFFSLQRALISLSALTVPLPQEQKLVLQNRSKDNHLNQLVEIEKRFSALSRQCAMVKQAHETLEQNGSERMD